MDLPTMPDRPERPKTSQSDPPDAGRPEPAPEEPVFVPEEDIPRDGPDVEGQKMIEALPPGTGRPPQQAA